MTDSEFKNAEGDLSRPHRCRLSPVLDPAVREEASRYSVVTGASRRGDHTGPTVPVNSKVISPRGSHGPL